MDEGKAWRYEILRWLGPGFVHAVSNPLMSVLNYSQFVAGELHQGKTGEDVAGLADVLVEESGRLEGLLMPFFHLLRKQTHDEMVITPLGVFVDGLGGLVHTSLRHERIEWLAEVRDGVPSITCDVQKLLFQLLSVIYPLSRILRGIQGDAAGFDAPMAQMIFIVGEGCSADGSLFQCKVCCKHGLIPLGYCGFEDLCAIGEREGLCVSVSQLEAGAFEVDITVL